MATLGYQTPADAPPVVPGRVTHLLAWLVMLLTLPLITLGGLVTSTGAGLAVPDWPNSFGYNMFALPLDRWLGAGSYESGVFQEHGHRLVGTLVGLAAIALFGWTWWKEKSTWLRTLATAILLAVVVQGVLGGLRVTEVSRTLAFLHGVFGQIVFALMIATVLLTGRWWWRQHRAVDPKVGSRALWLTRIAFGLVVLQLLLGATMRHDPARNHSTGSGAGLAIPDWPLHYGELVPPISSDGLAAANAMRDEVYDLPAVSLHQVWLHASHRAGAYITATFVLGLAVWAVWRRATLPGVWIWPVVFGLLVVVQVMLGISTVLLRKPADVATAHQFVGALLLATATVTVMRAARLHAGRPLPEPQRATSASAVPA